MPKSWEFRNVARTLAYLQNVYEATTAEIEKGTGMKQPDISLVIKELRKRDWLSEREEGTLGKGMPPKIISLKIGFNEIIALLEKQQKRKVNEMQSKIERSKTLGK